MIQIDISNQFQSVHGLIEKNYSVSMDESTGSTDTDASSVSTSSSDGDEMTSPRSRVVLLRHCQPTPHNRSIFNDYWQVKGGGSCIRRFPGPSGIDYEADSLAEQSTVSYEKTLEKSEEEVDLASSSNTSNYPPRRRRIFFGESESEPVLCHMALERSNDIRKIQSTSGLPDRRKKPKSSCIRKGRFSGPSNQDRSPQSVKFNNEISVLLFERPKEFYSHEGWSSYFS